MNTDRFITFLAFSMGLMPAAGVTIFCWSVVTIKVVPMDLVTICLAYPLVAVPLFNYLLNRRKKNAR